MKKEGEVTGLDLVGEIKAPTFNGMTKEEMAKEQSEILKELRQSLTNQHAKETAIAFKDWCNDDNEFNLIRANGGRPVSTEILFEHFMQEQNNRTDQTTKG